MASGIIVVISILDILSKEKKHIFIIGDFNIDVSKPYRCGKATQDFTNLLLSNSHFPLIHKPTRIVKSSASLIDNMYTNYTYDSCNCGILCSDVSDHFPVFCIIDCLSMTDKQSNTVTKRNFNCKNIAKFSRKLSSQNWNNVYNVDDAQIAFSVLQRVIDQLIEEIFPEQTIPVTYKTRLPWLNSKLKAAIKARNSLSNLCKQNPTDKELHKSYKLNRNQVTAQIRNAHITYQSNELDIVKNDISKSWNVLKAIIGLQSSKKTQNMSYIVNNKHITDSYDISNAFNNFFASIGSELAGNITSSINPLSYLKSVQNSMFMPKVSENEVKNIIMSFKNSAAGWDNFPTFVAKQCVDSYISPLTYIINRAISQGIFPSELKIARVIPIFKSGDKQNVSNYRPISILTFFAKVFEKILYNNISKFLDRNGSIHENQFGFRKGHSTNHAIITLIDKITKSVDNGDIAINIFIDLKKAFDTVSHEILLKKLFNYGIRGNVLQLCESYLTNRYQYVTFNGTKSLHKRVTCGVPQGSFLGPLFFLAYMNYIYNASQLLYNILYADDTCIYLSGNELSKLIKSMNSEIKLISDWLKANKLTLNIDKTYYMVFHRGRRKCFGNTELFIDNIKIKQTETMKYLGVIIDTKLNWISHITFVKNKVAKGIGIIRRARPLLNKSALRNLYHTFIYPYLTYCVEVWGSAKSVHLSPILLLQKKIIRLITFSERLAHTEPIFLQLNILPIDKLIQDRIGLFMYKMFHGLHPPTINNLYIQNCDVHNHNTRHRNYLHVSMAHSDLYAKSFYCSSILIWNEIMNKIEVSISFPQFKILLKRYLLVNSLKK